MSWPEAPEPPTSVAEAERMLRSGAAGPPPHGDDDPWDFVLRWPETVMAPFVWPVVSQLLEDADPEVRARAVSFVGNWPAGGPRAVERLMDVVTRRANVFREASQVDAVSFVLANLAVSFKAEAPRIARVIVVLLDGAPPRNGTATLSRYEPVALIASARRWTDDFLDQRSAASAASAMAMYRRDHLLDLLAALGNRTAEHRAEILTELESFRGIPDDKLALILNAEGIPLPHHSPTRDECRRALGL